MGRKKLQCLADDEKEIFNGLIKYIIDFQSENKKYTDKWLATEFYPEETERNICNQVSKLRNPGEKTTSQFNLAKQLKNKIDGFRVNLAPVTLSDEVFYKAIDDRNNNGFSEDERNHLIGHYLVLRGAASEPDRLSISYLEIFHEIGHKRILRFKAKRINHDTGDRFSTRGYIINNGTHIFASGRSHYNAAQDSYIESFVIKNTPPRTMTPQVGFFSGVSLHTEMEHFISKLVVMKGDFDFNSLNKTGLFGLHSHENAQKNEHLSNVFSMYRTTLEVILKNINFRSSKNVHMLHYFKYGRRHE